MKKILFFFLLISLFISCDSDKKTSEESTALSGSRFSDKDTLRRVADTLAVKMINNFKASNKKPKNFVWVGFNPLSLARIGSDTTVKSVRFFLAAYLDTEDGEKKNFPTIICQVIKQNASLVPTIEYYEADYYCPPPYDTDCPLEDSEFMTSKSAISTDSVYKADSAKKQLQK